MAAAAGLPKAAQAELSKKHSYTANKPHTCTPIKHRKARTSPSQANCKEAFFFSFFHSTPVSLLQCSHHTETELYQGEVISRTAATTTIKL